MVALGRRRRMGPPTVGVPASAAGPVVRGTGQLGLTPGRVVAVCGGAGVGKSTYCRIAAESCQTPVRVVTGVAGAEVLAAVDRERAAGAEVVLLDGVVSTAWDLQWLYDSRLVVPGEGLVAVLMRRDVALLEPSFMTQLELLQLARTTVVCDDMEFGAVRLITEMGVET